MDGAIKSISMHALNQISKLGTVSAMLLVEMVWHKAKRSPALVILSNYVSAPTKCNIKHRQKVFTH